MPIAYVQDSDGDAFSATRSPQITLTGAPTAGNIIVAACQTNTGCTFTAPADWFTVTDQPAGTTNDHWLGYRIVLGGDTANFTLTNLFDAGETGIISAVEVSGQHATTAIGAVQGVDWQFSFEGGALVNHAMTAWTPGTNDCMVIHFAFAEDATSGPTTARSWTQIIDLQNAANHGFAQYLIQTTAVAANPTFTTTTSSPMRHFGVTVRPAAGPTTHFGATTLTATVARTTAAKLTAKASTSTTETVGITTAATRTRFASSSLTETVGVSTVGRVTAKSSVSRPEVVTVTTTPEVTGEKFGATTLTETVAVGTSGHVTATGVVSLPAVVTVTTAAHIAAYATVTLPLVVTITTGAPADFTDVETGYIAFSPHGQLLGPTTGRVVR